MNIRWIRGGAVVFFLLFLVAVTWPGMMAGNRIFPLVLGLPFSMVWIATWVVLSFLVLILLDRAEGRAGHPEEGAPVGPPEEGAPVGPPERGFPTPSGGAAVPGSGGAEQGSPSVGGA